MTQPRDCYSVLTSEKRRNARYRKHHLRLKLLMIPVSRLVSDQDILRGSADWIRKYGVARESVVETRLSADRLNYLVYYR